VVAVEVVVMEQPTVQMEAREQQTLVRVVAALILEIQVQAALVSS
jgi:hypothetical protein